MCRLMVLFLVVFAYETGVDSCSKGDLVNNITDGFKSGTAIIKDHVRYESKNYYHDDGTIWGCICEVTKCLRKCCEDGKHPERVGTGRVCKPSPTDQHNLRNILEENDHTKEYKLFHAGFICAAPKYSVASNKTNLEKDFSGGVLKLYGMSLDVNDFCLDYMHNKLTSIICVLTEEEAVYKSVDLIVRRQLRAF